jgi:multidrug resistance efflux pump
MNSVRTQKELGRVAVPVALLIVGMLLLASCSMPSFGNGEEGPAEFEATPYVAGESVQVNAARAESPATAAESGEAAAEGAPAASADDAATADAASAEANDDEAATTDSENESSASAAPPGGALSYTAEIVAKNRVDVVAEVNGMVLNIMPEVGDFVQAGDLLVEIDGSTLEAQRAQALAALQAVQAQLDLALDQSEPEEADLEAARAAVNAAAAAYTRAVEGATEEDRRAALAQLKQAEAAVTVAQAAYNRVKGSPFIGALPESLQLQQATLAVEAAQAQYDKVLKGLTNDIISGAYAQLANARAQLERLERGPEDAQIRALEAQVKQAETALYLSQLQLDKTLITAPVDGIVASLNLAEGAMVGPGASVMQLLSPENEVVVAVEESRLSEVAVGIPVTIRVDAYPGRTFAGEVIRIAPELDPATRTINVTIQPVDEMDELAPGMFATVEIGQ